MIDITRCLLMVTTYPTFAIDHRMMIWFQMKGMPMQNIMAANYQCSMIEGRNRAMKEIIMPRVDEYEWFIFADKDAYPLDNLTDPFLEVVDGADVVGCEYKINNDSAWLKPDVFHNGLWRVKSETIRHIEPPWFMFRFNEDGTEIVDCDCEHLRKKFIQRGAKIVRYGFVGHDSDCTWHTSS